MFTCGKDKKKNKLFLKYDLFVCIFLDLNIWGAKYIKMYLKYKLK